MSGSDPPSPDRERGVREGPRRRWPVLRGLVFSGGGRGRRYLRWLAVAAVVLAGVVLLLTRTPLTRMIVVARAEAALGLDVSARSAVVAPDGSIVVRGAVFRLPGVPGPAGRALEVDRCRVLVDWGALARGGDAARRVNLVSPTLRVSIERDTERVNLERLADLLGARRGAGPAPEVIAREMSVELGEHAGERYEPLKRLRVDGRLVPAPVREGYLVSIRERPSGARGEAAGGEPALPLRASGRITDNAARMRIDRIDLAGWGPEAFPSGIRDVVAMLDVRGQVSRTRIAYTPDAGLSARMHLSGVGVNLPFDTRGRYAPSGRLARMRDVSGTIELSAAGVRAELDGQLEDLPYHASLDYAGTSLDSPFACTLVTNGFRLSEHPEFLPFAPPEFAEQLDEFSNPTARVDARVSIRRGQAGPEGPAPVELAGWLEVAEGTASFEAFPYPLRDLSGAVFFDNEAIELKLAGRNAKSGARVEINGTIEAPLPTARVDLDIMARELPIDGVLEDALGDNAAILDELIDEAHVPRDGAFSPGGRATAHIAIRRDRGEVSHWTWQADATFDRLGIVPAAFPLPMTGRDVELRISETGIELVDAALEPLGGGGLRVSLRAGFGASGRAGLSSLEAHAEALEPTPALLDAAEQAMARFDAAGLETLRRARRRLTPEGSLDAHLRFSAEGGEGAPRMDLSLWPRELALDAGTPEAPDALRIEGLEGQVGFTTDGVRADLVGVAQSGGRATEFSILARGDAGDGSGPGLSVEVPRFDAGMPVERVIGALSPEAGRRIARLRAQHEPEGRGYVIASLRPGEGVPSPRVEVERLEGAALTTAVGRLRARDTRGRLIYEPDRGVRFEGFGARVALEPGAGGGDGAERSAPPGAGAPFRVAIDGTVPLGSGGVGGARGPGAESGPAIRVGVGALPLDSPAARWVFERSLGERGARGLEAIRLAGETDLSIRARQRAGRWNVSGTVSPSALSFERGGERVDFERFEGAIGIEREGVVFDGLVASGPDATLSIDGRFTPGAGGSGDGVGGGAGVGTGSLAGGGSFAGSVALDAPGLTADARALLPAGLLEALAGVSFEASGPVAVHASDLSVEVDSRGVVPAASASGWASLSGVSARVGASITDAEASLRFSARAGADVEPEFEVDLSAGSLRMQRVRMREASARLSNGDRPREVIVADFRADSHGGRIGGEAALRRGVRLSGEAGTRFDLRMLASGVRFKPLLDDIGGAPAVRGASSGSGGAGSDASRGVLGGELVLGGWIGDRGSLRGRGAVRVSNGRVLNMPLVVPLMEVSSFQLPGTGRIDLALARFYVEGERVIFGEMLALARALEIFGYGSMHWPSRELDLWFDTRGRRRVPLLGWLLEGLRSELVTARVTGPLGRQRVRVSPLRTTRGLLDRMLTGSPSAAERRLATIRRRALSQRAQLRRVGERMRVGEAIEPVSGVEGGSDQ